MKQIIVSLCLLLFFSCSKDDSSTNPNDDQTTVEEDPVGQDPNATIADNVVVLLDNNSNLISSEDQINNGIYVVDFIGEIPELEIDDIIVGNEGMGFLRRVNSIDISGNTVTFQTTQAYMEDVFGNIDFNFSIDTSDLGRGMSTFDLSGINIFNIGNVSLDITQGSIDFNPTFNFDFKFDSFSLEKFDMNTQNSSFDVDSRFTLSATAGLSVTPFEKVLSTVVVNRTVMVGPVPVAITIIKRIKAQTQISLEGTGSLSWRYQSLNSWNLGAKYENNTWEVLSDMNSDFIAHPQEQNDYFTLGTSIALVPEVTVAIYGVLGPSTRLEASGNFEMNSSPPSDNWDASIFLKNELKFGVDFGNLIFDNSITLPVTSLELIETPLWNAPAKIEAISDTELIGLAGQAIQEPIKVKVLDNFNLPVVDDISISEVSNVRVYFEVTQGGGSVSESEVITDENGNAEVTWTLGETNEPNQLIAKVKKANGAYISSEAVFNANIEDAELIIEGEFDFGEVPINESSSTNFTISNPSNIDIEVNSINLPVGYETDWTSGIIMSEESQEITITFDPSEIQTYSGDFTINSTLSQNIVEQITGEGISPFELPDPIDFGTVSIGFSDEQPLTISNISGIPISVSDLTLPSDFTSNWNGGVINANSQQNIVITFTPTQEIDYSGSIIINNDSDSTNNVINVIASGLEVELLLEGNLDFGSVPINDSSESSLIISNPSEQDVNVSALNLPPGFTSNWTNGTIMANGNQNIIITFTPTQVQNYNGEMIITSNLPNDSIFQLTGEGISPLSLPTSISFGEVTIDSSESQILSISNISNQPINITSINLPSGYSSDWNGGMIAGNSNQEITITFTPTEEIEYNGVVTINNDVDPNNNTVNISGSGIPIVIDLDGQWVFIPSSFTCYTTAYDINGDLLYANNPASCAVYGVVDFNDDGSVNDGYGSYYGSTYTLIDGELTITGLRDSGNIFDQLSFTGTWNEETQTFNGTVSRTFREWLTDQRNQLMSESTLTNQTTSLERF